MRITITGKKFEVSDYLRDLVEKKLSKLDKYFKKDTEITVILSLDNKSQIAEITVPYEGGVIRAEESTTDMYASIDGVLEKLEKQLHRYRHKRNGKAQRNSTIRTEFMDAFVEEEDKDKDPAIVKVKKFDVKPMTEEDAMLQIEMLGHAFFVYEDADTGSINVLYKRKDGNYGLIETKR